MPDLLAHMAAARIAAAPVRRELPLLLVLLGAALPDLGSKFMVVLVDADPAAAMTPHSFLGAAVLCYGLCFLFEHALRGMAFLSLYFGAVMHILLDLTKRFSSGGISVFAPFTYHRIQFGWLHSEDFIYGAPISLAVLLLWRSRAR